ncbi:hypothetical protein CSHISOI_11511 [Colletotrichum shisoi]|uniref:Uncharacterized protein n=1 Tax=Colletotrichum shisoi TaxID=2078593 RepID=A0A5Q4BAG9_9PEZI|nr:hypothetical protein CSHISOI_11511 [Colletotrichum shisoi]
MPSTPSRNTQDAPGYHNWESRIERFCGRPDEQPTNCQLASRLDEPRPGPWRGGCPRQWPPPLSPSRTPDVHRMFPFCTRLIHIQRTQLSRLQRKRCKSLPEGGLTVLGVGAEAGVVLERNNQVSKVENVSNSRLLFYQQG